MRGFTANDVETDKESAAAADDVAMDDDSTVAVDEDACCRNSLLDLLLLLRCDHYIHYSSSFLHTEIEEVAETMVATNYDAAADYSNRHSSLITTILADHRMYTPVKVNSSMDTSP